MRDLDGHALGGALGDRRPLVHRRRVRPPVRETGRVPEPLGEVPFLGGEGAFFRLLVREDGRRYRRSVAERASVVAVEFATEREDVPVGASVSRETLARVDLPVIVDAVAIEPALSGDLSNTVFAPDEGEEEAVVDEYGSLERFSETTGAIVVMTGDVDTIVVDGEETTNETGTPALTVAGTGDTLTGVIASLLSQGLNRAEAAELGAWIVGKAGELATAERGNGLVATDVIERIPDTIR